MYEYIELDKTGGTMPVYVIFVLGLCHMTWEIFFLKSISHIKT